MRERFHAGTGEVDVPKCFVVDYAEILAALWRDIYVACGGERRRGDPEDLLVQDPGYEAFGDGFVEDAHGG